MRDYKVGDTIYIKDTVADITPSDKIATYRGYYNGWVATKTIIDELPTAEPVKPVLPKGVADELETIKKLNVTFDGYIMRVISDQPYYTNSHTFWINSDDGVIKILMDAWYNGYTVENPKLYNLILGTREDSPLQAAFLKITDWDDNAHISLNAGSIPHDLTIPQYQFTQEEIDKYNKNFWIKNLDLNDYKVEVKDDEEV